MPYKVLFIDDSHSNAEIIAYRLKRLNFEVHTAPDGFIGIDVAQRIAPDIILMDYMLPGINGGETIRRMRDIDELKEVPIVMVTADCQPIRQQEAINLGCADFLCKPVTASRLKETLKLVLGDDILDKAAAE